MALPLDKKFYTTKDAAGKEERLPVLHPKWVEKIDFILYQPMPKQQADAATWEEWEERLTFIESDLHQLLCMSHDKFWCQVVFDVSLQRCLDAYLKHAPRSYDKMCCLPEPLVEKHDNLHRLFFMVYLRMSTHKESKEDFITPEVFGEILYENFLFDIPKIMDLCILYGADNGPLVSKMISNIFTKQPNYNEDLRQVIPTVLQVLETVQKKLGVKRDILGTPQKLSDSSNSDPVQKMAYSELRDIMLYIADTAATLSSFLEIYPPAAAIFREEEFPNRLAVAYENLVGGLKEAFKSRKWENKQERALLVDKLHQTQDGILRVFRHIVFQTCLQPLLEARFLGHLVSLFPFQDDKDLLDQAPYILDETRIQFLQEAIVESFMTFGKGRKQQIAAPDVEAPALPSSINYKPTPSAAAASYPVKPKQQEGATAGPAITGIQLDSLITSVKDLLPHLGDGFIQMCLEEYNYDMERTLNCILEDKLSPWLRELDTSMPRVLREEEKLPETLLSRRANVYDDDQFDVFTRDNVDMSKIHMGKKDKSIGLDDHTSREITRNIYQQYNLVEDEEEPANRDYDDEYDDTYDTNLVGAEDADSADELTTRRPFTMPRVLGGRDVTSSSNKNESSSEESDSEEGLHRDKFIEDPAKIRERQEERRAQKQARQQHKAPPGNQPRNRDVVGNPRGQGQDSQVLKNRLQKEKNKASRVHHNRKVLSDKKRLPKF